MRQVLGSAPDDLTLFGRPLREYAETLPVPVTAATIVLDPCCPLVPAEFVALLVERTEATGRAHVGIRPVTDTVKQVSAAGVVGPTVDREGLVQVVGPVVLPPGSPAPDAGSVLELVSGRPDLVRVEAPALARRVSDASEAALVEALAQSMR